ncbi:caspase family protein [Aestuariispira insulae]|uniref:Peptidase C14 caspase domain-containing protein n=1 Tax=Aestuariispira insulae TaxID=1461337 RepID=A0A3D9HW65_9PROT|nr:caspase family protein [Aestuariispira insulae]RED53655.1 hypothetical protein DFP90_101447 [Aestuariispira insulae]
MSFSAFVSFFRSCLILLCVSGGLLGCQTVATNVQQVDFSSDKVPNLPLQAQALLLMMPDERNRSKTITIQNFQGTQVPLREGRAISNAGEKVLGRIFANVERDALSHEPQMIFVVTGSSQIDTFWLTFNVTATIRYFEPDGTLIGSAQGRSLVAGSMIGQEMTLEDAYVKALVIASRDMLKQPAFLEHLEGGTLKTAPLNLAALGQSLGFKVDAPLMKQIAAKELEQRMGHEMELMNGTFRVKAGEAIIRQFPNVESDARDRVAQGGLLHILGQLPDGWMQVAREGKPFGWVHGSALAMESQQAVAIARRFPQNPVDVRFSAVPSRPDDIAVIIANADYARAGRDIPAVEPAYADAAGFRLYATQALGVRPGNIIELKDATQADLISVFGTDQDHRARLYNWVKPGVSRVYVYYAGHGAPGSDGSAYLVPTDANPSTLHLNGYRLSNLYRNLSKSRARSVTVVLEACFSGSAEGGAVINNASPVFLNVKQVSIPKGLSVIAAGGSNQMASWDQDRQHSLFTTYFLKGMSGEADKPPHGNANGRVTYDELDRYLQQTLTYFARRYYGRDQQAQIVEAGS